MSSHLNAENFEIRTKRCFINLFTSWSIHDNRISLSKLRHLSSTCLLIENITEWRIINTNDLFRIQFLEQNDQKINQKMIILNSNRILMILVDLWVYNIISYNIIIGNDIVAETRISSSQNNACKICVYWNWSAGFI